MQCELMGREPVVERRSQAEEVVKEQNSALGVLSASALTLGKVYLST